jgi:hypothetical protein
MEIEDAMEVSITGVWIMLKTKELLQQTNMFTMLRLKHAKNKVEHSKLVLLILLEGVVELKKQFNQDLLVFQLMLLNGVNMLLVFSATVVLASTTTLY